MIAGNPSNCSYPNRHDVTDEAGLKAAICHDYVCAEYKNHYRNNDNFIGSDCLPVDCDNDHSEEPSDWITVDDVAAAFPGVTFAVHYSRHHNREKNGKAARPKFHVKTVVRQLNAKFPLDADDIKDNEVIKVKGITSSEVDSALNNYMAYGVMLDGRSNLMFCVNSGSNLRTQYRFDTLGYGRKGRTPAHDYVESCPRGVAFNL